MRWVAATVVAEVAMASVARVAHVHIAAVAAAVVVAEVARAVDGCRRSGDGPVTVEEPVGSRVAAVADEVVTGAVAPGK